MEKGNGRPRYRGEILDRAVQRCLIQMTLNGFTIDERLSQRLLGNLTTRGRQIAQYAHRCMQIAALVQFARYCLCNLRARAIQNLILTKTRNGIKDVNLDRLLFTYINERILNRLAGAGKKKLSYTHGVLASDEELTELEDLMLRRQDEEGLEDFNWEEDRDENDEGIYTTEYCRLSK